MRLRPMLWLVLFLLLFVLPLLWTAGLVYGGSFQHWSQARWDSTGLAPDPATTPEPPYYAVIFTSKRTEGDHGYEAIAQAMFELSLQQPGCLGAESARDEGVGITVAYFTDEHAIRNWKQNVRHLAALKLGKERWYSHYELRVAKVERAYSGPEGR